MPGNLADFGSRILPMHLMEYLHVISSISISNYSGCHDKAWYRTFFDTDGKVRCFAQLFVVKLRVLFLNCSLARLFGGGSHDGSVVL